MKEYSVKQPLISHLSYEDRMRHLSLPSLQYHLRRGDLINLYQILRGNYNIDNHLFTHPLLLQEVTQRNYSSTALNHTQDKIL